MNARWNSSSWPASSCATNASSMPTRFSAVTVATVTATIP